MGVKAYPEVSGREDEEAALFSHLRALSRSMTTEGRAVGDRFEAARFEALVDNFALVRPADRFGDFRYIFYGSALSETCPGGDLNGVAFHDLFGVPYYRAALAGFLHVHRVGLAHVTRDQPMAGGRRRFFTRLLIPIFAANRTSLILCAKRLHDEPTRTVGCGRDDELRIAASA